MKPYTNLTDSIKSAELFWNTSDFNEVKGLNLKSYLNE